MHKIKLTAGSLKKDCTEEVKNFVKKQSFLYKRLFKAFPNFKFINILKKK